MQSKTKGAPHPIERVLDDYHDQVVDAGEVLYRFLPRFDEPDEQALALAVVACAVDLVVGQYPRDLNGSQEANGCLTLDEIIQPSNSQASALTADLGERQTLTPPCVPFLRILSAFCRERMRPGPESGCRAKHRWTDWPLGKRMESGGSAWPRPEP
ncbi:MAG: hypothetical protein AB1898_08250 [Acidobacteriota bacterium]